MKKVLQKQKSRQSTSQQPGTQSASRSVNKPLINHVPDLSNPKPVHTTGGSSRGDGGAARRDRAGWGADRTARPEDKRPRTAQSLEDTSPERLPRSTNKQNPM